MTPVDPPVSPELKRQYPHVDNVADWRAQQSIRLLWDRVFDLEARLQGNEETVLALIDASNAQEQHLDYVGNQAMEALAGISLTPGEAKTAAAIAGSGGASGKDDHGLGAEGCGTAPATGHLTGTFDKTVTNAGKVVCGVGNEFPALLAATPDYATRLANREQLLERMVWHLNQAGFAASRYGTAGSEHAFNLLFDCLALDGTPPVRQYAYRVTTYDPNDWGVPPVTWDTTHTIQTCMVCNGQTPGGTTPPGAGTAD